MPCESGVILELGTVDLLQEDTEVLRRIRSVLWPEAPALHLPAQPVQDVSFVLQEFEYGDDTLPSDTYSPEFHLSSNQTGTSTMHLDYGTEVVEQWYHDVNIVSKTVASLPVATDHCALNYITCLPTATTTNNLCPTQTHGKFYSQLTDSVVQRGGQLTAVPQNAWIIEQIGRAHV